MKHLWEADDTYYASSYHGDEGDTFESWADYAEGDYASAVEPDDGLNVMYAWQWYRPQDDKWYDPEDYAEEDEDYRKFKASERLKLAFVAPRKGYIWTCEVAVTAEDEQKVRDWLTAHWHQAVRRWMPVSGEIA